MKFRIYEDNTIIDEDSFELVENNAQFTSDFEEIEVPDEIMGYIQEGRIGTFDY